jgi:hypothetical protein
MPKYLIFILFIGLVIFMEISCDNCEPASQFLLTEQQKKQNPFKGFEKIIFNSGDSTIEFNGTGRNNRIMEYEFHTSHCDRSFREYDELNFSSTFYEVYFKMQGQNSFSIFFNDSIRDVFVESWFYVESDPNKNSGYAELIDTLNIDGTQFFNIYKDTLYQNYSMPDFPDSLKHATYLYYSINYGIVKFDFSDGSTWELKEIVW